MIRHSVAFKFKDQLSGTEKQRFFEAAQQLATIEGVQHFEVLKQTSLKNEYEFGLAMVFENAKDYQRYNANAAHNFFIQHYWVTMVEKFLEIDYEPIVDIGSYGF